MKKIFSVPVLVACVTIACSAFAAGPAPQQCGNDKLISGSGDAKGTFGTMTRNLQETCPVVCEYHDEKTGEPSTGGFMNANLITTKKADIGIIPESVLEISKRTDPLVVKKVRSLGNLHTNGLHILVPKGGITLTGDGYKILGFDTGRGKTSTQVYIKDISDLSKRKVAVFASALVDMTLANERLGYNIELVEVKTKEEGMRLLDEGKVFAFVASGGWPIPWVDQADAKKYTLANVSDQDIRKLGAPFYQTTLNYQTLGAYGVNTIGTRNILATWDFTSGTRAKQLKELKECIATNLADIKETRGSHPSWNEIEAFTTEGGSWPKWEEKTTTAGK